MKKMLAILFITTLFFACQKQERLQHQQDIQLIKDYLAQNNILAEEDPDANFFYHFTAISGDSIHPVYNSKLEVVLEYNCKLLDGTLIYDTNNTPDTIRLDQTMHGWQLALQLMSIGDQMQLWLPSRLAYGTEGTGTIPPNSVLEFNIYLKEIYPHF